MFFGKPFISNVVTVGYFASVITGVLHHSRRLKTLIVILFKIIYTL